MVRGHINSKKDCPQCRMTEQLVHGGKAVRVGGSPSSWGPVGHNVIIKGDDGSYTTYQEFGTDKNTSIKKVISKWDATVVTNLVAGS